MSLVGKLLSVDQMLMAAAAIHPEAPPALPTIEACRTDVEIVRVSRDDRLARTVLSQVAIENSRRYGGTSCGWFTKLRVGTGGTFLVAVSGGEPVAGGEFRSTDDNTAEVTRIWTSSTLRRRGLGSRILARLEAEAAAHGHRRVTLSTGPGRPDVHALCRRAGYQLVRATELGTAVWGKELSVVRAPLAVSA